MIIRFYKTLIILGIVITFLITPSFWILYSAPNGLEVSFLDVGQGDSILIETPFGQNILIDGGPDNSVIENLGNNLPWWDKTIDLMILTHPHDDHVSGLIDVIKRYKIEQILYTAVNHDSPNYLTWLELIQERNIPLTIIDKPQKIIFGNDCFLDILYPKESFLAKNTDNLNNTSIVSKLICAKNSFLFTGDIELEVESELIENKVDLSANVLKACHHGSDTSNSQEFLEAVNPKIIVIQSGENDFGHPSRRVIKRFERLGADIFRNDKDGTVQLKIDNYKINVRNF